MSNLMSNQDLIDQLNADKIRLGNLVTEKENAISNNNSAIDSYTQAITSLNDLTADYEGDITNLEIMIANDDLIIAFIPPDPPPSSEK